MMLAERTNTFYRMHVHSFTGSGDDWVALATAVEELYCGPGSGNGCGDLSFGAVSPRYPTSGSFGLSSGLPNPWFVLLATHPDATASVELSVAPTPTTMSRVSQPGRPSAG